MYNYFTALYSILNKQREGNANHIDYTVDERTLHKAMGFTSESHMKQGSMFQDLVEKLTGEIGEHTFLQGLKFEKQVDENNLVAFRFTMNRDLTQL